MPSAGLVALIVKALARGKLKPASRNGQKGSMANLEEAGAGSEDSPSAKGHTHTRGRCGGRGLSDSGVLWEP